ncbi:MAG: tRNA epoxyqueuosine(34) reductase QueG [Bacteroidetes bacterium]|nr:tRNA epoxyqueuosine(34) reductase QueG [Bacteroidota bacterium]
MPLYQSNKVEISKKIKEFCFEAGFDAVGISQAKELNTSKENLSKWLENNYNASMQYMANNLDKRANPTLLFENCKSIISLAINYYTPITFNSKNQYAISKYALGKDYHFIIKEKLHSIIKHISELTGIETHRGFVDSAPVFERTLAVEAGLGWIGKNSCLIIPQKGSFYFLAEIYSTLELEYDNPFLENHCGNCSKCIEACPTKAIVAPGVIDSQKCISCLTIESKDDLPESIAQLANNQIFGCDICQDVCPHNLKFAKTSYGQHFKPIKQILNLNISDWEVMNENEFNCIFKKAQSPLARSGYGKIMRNIKAYKNGEEIQSGW